MLKPMLNVSKKITTHSYTFEPFYLLEEKTAIFDEIFKFMIYLMRGT